MKTGKNLSYEDLRDADLRGADLRGANLKDTAMYGVDFSGAILDQAIAKEFLRG